jgi:hypothetical protein
MLRREQEAVIFLAHVFPFDKDSPGPMMIESLDINPTLVRVCNNCFEESEGGGVMFSGAIKKSPWKRIPPTLAGSVKLVVRHWDDASQSILVRCVDAHEYFRLIGWDISMFKARGPFTAVGGFDDIELLANMAGNAWSAFQYAGIFVAHVATAGKFRKEKPFDDNSQGGASGSSGDPARIEDEEICVSSSEQSSEQS